MVIYIQSLHNNILLSSEDLTFTMYVNFEIAEPFCVDAPLKDLSMLEVFVLSDTPFRKTPCHIIEHFQY